MSLSYLFRPPHAPADTLDCLTNGQVRLRNRGTGSYLHSHTCRLDQSKCGGNCTLTIMGQQVRSIPPLPPPLPLWSTCFGPSSLVLFFQEVTACIVYDWDLAVFPGGLLSVTLHQKFNSKRFVMTSSYVTSEVQFHTFCNEEKSLRERV
jgi:hypothetical protein